jgi:hypothetical protein
MATRVLTTGRTLATAWEGLLRLLATWSPAGTVRQIREFLWPTAVSLRDRWLRLIWLPFWIGTDLASPRTHHSIKVEKNLGPASRRLISYLTSVRRRQMVNRFATLIARSIALALSVGAVWAGWAAIGGPLVDGGLLMMIGLALVAIGLLFGFLHRPGLRATARMLDRSFELSDRMSTAFDHLATGPDRRHGKPHLAYLQIAEATNTAAILGKHRVLRMRFPVRELVLITGMALLFLGLYLLRGTGTGLPGTGNPVVPTFISAKDRLEQQPNVPTTDDRSSQDAPTVAEVQARADESSAAEQDLLTLADALDDNPLTSPIADSIRAGDYERAAEQLEAVASEVSQLSPETREELADRLDEAADGMSGKHPGLQDATASAADGMRSDAQQAESSLSDLSEQISETGRRVESQEELAGDMREAREADGQRSSSSDTRPEPGDSQDGDEGEQAVAGEGGDAAPGQDDQSGDGQQTEGSTSDSGDGSQQNQEGEPGESGSGEDQDGSSGQTSSGGSSGESSQSGDEGSGEASSGDVQGDGRPQQGNTGGESDDARTGAGSGAGSGESGDTQSSSGAEQDPLEGSDDSPDPNVVEGESGGSGSADDSSGDGRSSITLSRSPDESGVRTGGAASSSSGSGSGAAAGTGSASQGDVGVAGPDSNRVPKRYREIVEDYFSDEP